MISACTEERCECGAIAEKIITNNVLGIFRGKDFTRHNTLKGSSKKGIGINAKPTL